LVLVVQVLHLEFKVTMVELQVLRVAQQLLLLEVVVAVTKQHLLVQGVLAVLGVVLLMLEQEVLEQQDKEIVEALGVSLVRIPAAAVEVLVQQVLQV
jgi:hypothetical protein